MTLAVAEALNPNKLNQTNVILQCYIHLLSIILHLQHHSIAQVFGIGFTPKDLLPVLSYSYTNPPHLQGVNLWSRYLVNISPVPRISPPPACMDVTFGPAGEG